MIGYGSNPMISVLEGEVLFELAKKSEKAIVELGTWCGRSTCCLAKGSRMGNKVSVYAISLFSLQNWKNFEKNIADRNLQDTIKVFNMKSSEAPNLVKEEIGLLFVDASHNYDDVTNDIKKWVPKVVTGGIILFHDYTNPAYQGVTKAVDEAVEKGIIEINKTFHKTAITTKL